jgi:hypothetical protein
MLLSCTFVLQARRIQDYSNHRYVMALRLLTTQFNCYDLS